MIDIIKKKLSERYACCTRLLLFTAILVFLMHLFYRIRIYRYILSLHPDISFQGFTGYLHYSLPHDSMILFWSIAALLLILLPTTGIERLKYIVSGTFSLLFIFFMLFSMEFFRVYQTTFQKDFTGKEHFTGLGNVLDSALAEFSLEFYILLFTLSALSFLAIWLIYRHEEKTGAAPCTATPPGFIARTSVPAAAVISLLVGIFTGLVQSEKSGNSHAAALMHEFAINPLYDLLSCGPSGPEKKSPFHTYWEKHFSFGLNTESIESSRRCERIDSIPRPKKYNIILYFFESTPRKYYDLKVNGRTVLQTWHRLEKNSLSFKRHYANYPLSANALLSVFTSAYDHNSKAMVIQEHPDIGLRTLPEILKSRGYRTCLIHTGDLAYAGQKRFLQKRGFDALIERKQLIGIPPYTQVVGWGIDDRAMIWPATSFIRKDPGKPFFMIFLPVNPHHPYAIPEDVSRILDEPEGNPDGRGSSWHNYLNSLHYADLTLGMLVDELERQGLMHNTLLFLFADHGEAFYQHRMNYNHPLFIYEENIHIPFLVYNRTLFPSTENVDSVSRHIDILPTILDILGIQPSPMREGVSLLSPRREQMALIHTSWKDDYMGIVDRQWKYIRRTDDGLEELYDLDRDPDEKNNMAVTRREIAGRYRYYIMSSRAYRDEYYRRVLAGTDRDRGR
ncbi:MAG: sulfatase-like hydrolase/transferase [Spirochaetes bacterium]|nr:sulfatase-like hydrolase/transferase [Spirochaetota bacterium]